MRIDVLTLFPEIFKGPLDVSIIKRAREKGILDIQIHNLRDFSENKHKKVDDYPYGGGPGMVIKPDVLFRAIEAQGKGYVIYLSPQGIVLNQGLAYELAKKGQIIFLCGHYEGIDERVKTMLDLELSIGDYITTGGEIPCLVAIDVIARFIPGVLGNPESLKDESFASSSLESPQYTRPYEFRGMRVPDILLSGDHKKIEEWRKEKAKELTRERRPDLLNED
ncbi:MAG: tRNA (guanosine(37)-N1)-methyltransferase TrmD [bacterium]